MDSILKLFTRCMAVAVIAMPLCVFASVDVSQVERPHANVQFDFTKPAADFKAEVDKKAKKAKVSTKKGSWLVPCILACILTVPLSFIFVFGMIGFTFIPGFTLFQLITGVGLTEWAVALTGLCVAVWLMYVTIKNDDTSVSEPIFISQS